MNIFVLDLNPIKAAKYHNNKHCVKMILESAQMLSTVMKENNCLSNYLYKASFKNHPCTKWAGQSLQNFFWLASLAKNLCIEYTKRYDKKHKSEKIIDFCLLNLPDLPNIGLLPFAQAMPDFCKSENAVTAYRTYYVSVKLKTIDCSWKFDKPDWIHDEKYDKSKMGY